jgi:hypothetical protein
MSTIQPLSVEDAVDLYKLERFTNMGFDGGAIAALLFWGTSPHDVEPLLWRDGERTTCTQEQALRIVKPLELAAGLTPAKLPACVVCDDLGCEHCSCEHCSKV